jgi:hypothetical protein
MQIVRDRFNFDRNTGILPILITHFLQRKQLTQHLAILLLVVMGQSMLV